MAITEYEINAFLLGAAIGSFITYWNLTRERRIIANVRSWIETLGSCHGLTPGQYRQTIYSTELVSNEEIIALHNWAQQRIKLKESPLKLSATVLTAETIICEKLLRLSYSDAIRALLSVKNIDDLGAYLQAIKRPQETQN